MTPLYLLGACAMTHAGLAVACAVMGANKHAVINIVFSVLWTSYVLYFSSVIA